MTHNLDKIEHIVVLMLENRSFDNMLGWLYDPTNEPPFDKVPRGQTFNGVSGKKLSNPIPPGANTHGAPPDLRIPVRRGEKATNPNPDPGEEYEHINTQLFGTVSQPLGCWQRLWQFLGFTPANKWPDPAPMNGFVKDYIDNFTRLDKRPPTYDQYKIIMDCLTPNLVPVISQLAYHYAVCDNWHCSVPSQTFCNRAFAICGTSHGYVINEPYVKWLFTDAPSIFDRIQQAKRPDLTWKVYFDEVDIICLTQLIQPSLLPYHKTHFAHMSAFEADAKSGTLPSYSFIEPRLLLDHNDQHPPIEDPIITSSILAGELLIKRVYEAVRCGANWEKTLLVITYDEHGGCYDHVAPPKAVAPHPAAFPGQQGFMFDRLGVRVPAVVVSPYTEAGTVDHTLYDHTSLIKTITNRWDLPHLTERDRHATDLSGLLNRHEARGDYPEITPRPYIPPGEASKEAINELQRAVLVAATGFVQLDRIHDEHPLDKKIEDLMRLIRDESDVFELKTVGEAVHYLAHILQPDG